MSLWVRLSLSTRPCWNFTDVTLADDRAFHGNVAITFGTNASDVTWWANFEHKCIFEWNMILRNTGNLKLTNTRVSQSRSSGQREQTLSWFWCLHEMGNWFIFKIYLSNNFFQIAERQRSSTISFVSNSHSERQQNFVSCSVPKLVILSYS